jgi:FAD/FMN-containing dehydrogenase
MATIAPSDLALDLAALRARSTGPVVGPADAGYDEARMPWNVAYDQRPAAVAQPADARDVAAVGAAARAAGLRVAVQGTGHAAHGLGDLSRSVLLRTSGMTGVTIDPAGRSARVEAGVLWQDVTPQASEHGLAALAGSSPDVGVVGYSLGGGIGYLARKHGLAANRVTAIELVTADGERVRTDADHDPDLFWALRGGSGNFGVVTAMEFDLVPVPELYAGAMFWPAERASEVLRRWLELTHDAPDELTTMARILQLPPLPVVPEPLRGRHVVNVQAAFLGDPEAGAAALAGLRELGPEIDLMGPMPPVGLMRLHGDPEGPTPGLTEGCVLATATEATVDTLAELGGPGSGSPLVVVELRHLGGALSRVPDGAGALATLPGEYAYHSVGIAAGPEAAAAVAAHGRTMLEAVRPWDAGRAYLNFAGDAPDARDVFAQDAYARLLAVQSRVDPAGVFHTGMPLG